MGQSWVSPVQDWSGRLAVLGSLSGLCFLYAHTRSSLDWHLMKDLHPPIDYTNTLRK